MPRRSEWHGGGRECKSEKELKLTLVLMLASRYVQRLEPISFSSTSLTPEVVAEQSAKLIEKTFHAYAKANGTTTLTVRSLVLNKTRTSC